MSKYKNPIDKPDTVTIPRWEYARLLVKATNLLIIEKMVKELPSYSWENVMKLVIEKEEEY